MNLPFLPVTASDLIQALNWRYATKAFDPAKKITPETWQALEETLVLTPSSFGLQPWKFIIVTDQAVKDSLVPHSWSQVQVSQCSHLVVMAAKKEMDAAYIDRFIQRTAEVRNTTFAANQGYRDMMVNTIVHGPLKDNVAPWAKLQTYIAMGNFMTAAALLGIDTCPMEGFIPAEYDKILGLEAKGLTSAVLCPAGYRAESDKYAHLPKVRFSVSDIVERV